jgi:zinc transport system ATP-binding protein
MQVMEARRLGVALGGRPIVRDVDLTVSTGDVVALLGSNGSGKSTLVRALLGLAPATTGDVRLFGTPLPRFGDWYRVGYVPQRSTIAQGVPATVREVVASGRLARRRPFVPARAADRTAVSEAIHVVGLEEQAGQAVMTLSGGQQQRVLVARALAVQPDLLVLDEPNAGVDLASQDAIAATLDRLIGAGVTILVVLHELGPFEPLITRTLVMRQGRVVHDGPPPTTAFDGHDHHHPPYSRIATPDVQGPLEGGH